MSLKDIWNKTSFARKAEEERVKKEEDDKLREKVKQEIQPELERIKMDKIKEEELARARGTYVEPEKKKNPLAMLGEEFKSSNIGSNAQMEKILGKQSSGGMNVNVNGEFSGKGNMLGNTERLLNTVTSDKRVNTNRDFGSMLGKDKLQRDRDLPGMLDGGKSFGGDLETKRKLMAEKVGGMAKEKDEEKIRRMLGSRK